MWLVNHIIKNWSTLSERVERESREQQEQEREVMRQRYERFRNQTVTPPGLIDDDIGDDEEEEDMDGNPFKPIAEAVQVADKKKEVNQNGDSKIPLRSSKRNPAAAAAKSKVTITRSQPEPRTAVPAKREKNKSKPAVDPQKKVPVRKTVLGSSNNKVAPITR
jgi:hypothetical protein